VLNELLGVFTQSVAIRLSALARSDAAKRGQGPSSKAERAARTAASTSAAPPSATSARTSLAEELRVSKVRPAELSRNAPSMECAGDRDAGHAPQRCAASAWISQDRTPHRGLANHIRYPMRSTTSDFENRAPPKHRWVRLARARSIGRGRDGVACRRRDAAGRVTVCQLVGVACDGSVTRLGSERRAVRCVARTRR
jgi:hypothetical protein